MTHGSAYLIIYSAVLLGGSSLIAFILFLLIGSFHILNLELSKIEILFVDTGLSLLFFIQHSVMIRKTFQQKATRFLPPHSYSAFYAIISGITLIVLIILWQKSSCSFGTITGIYRYLFRLLFFLSIAGFIWGMRALRFFDPYGIRPILYDLRNKQLRQIPFVVKGPYKWVRHPLYFFMLIMIWACPDLTADRFLFNILWTLWIVIGTFLEERDLVIEFGNEYREYQKKVPMLVPFRLSKFNRESAPY